MMSRFISLELAEKLINCAVEKAKKLGLSVSVAVVDEGGWLVALHRMDGAPPSTPEMARDKAWTAASFRMPTSKVSSFGSPINSSNLNDRVTTIPGGLPIKINGRVIGGIGIAGGIPEEDERICMDVLRMLEDSFEG